MVAVPLLSRFSSLPAQTLYPTCVGMIFPVCAVSGGVYLLTGAVTLTDALPYLAGGLAGGWLSGKLYKKVPTTALKWLFAAFLLYAGVKYLL